MVRASIAIVALGTWLVGCGGDDHAPPPTVGPAAPAELAATPLPGPSVHVTWKDKSTDEDGFVLERKVGSGAFSLLTSPMPNETAHHDAEVMAGMMYTYRIAAKNGKGVSAFSNEAMATTPAMVP